MTIIHDDILSKVRKEMTEDSRLVQMAELFKALDDPTRLKIINALLLAEMCVCDISALLNMTQPARTRATALTVADAELADTFEEEDGNARIIGQTVAVVCRPSIGQNQG